MEEEEPLMLEVAMIEAKDAVEGGIRLWTGSKTFRRPAAVPSKLLALVSQ